MRFLWLLLVIVAVTTAERSEDNADNQENEEEDSPSVHEDDSDHPEEEGNTESPVQEPVTDIPQLTTEGTAAATVGEVAVEGRSRSKPKAKAGDQRLLGLGGGLLGAIAGSIGGLGINQGLGGGIGSGFGVNPVLGSGINPNLPFGTGFGGLNSGFGLGGGFPAPVAPSSTCRFWCRTPEGQFYCCENINQPQSFVGVVKPGICPPVRPVCPPVRNFQPPVTCSNDGACGGYDKCCFDRCLSQHVCKFPDGFGR